MKRIKCRYCGAKPRVKFSVVYRGLEMCHDCSCEYGKIFDGRESRKDKKAKENPLFESFKRGWRLEEEVSGLEPLEIPQAIKEYYDRLLGIEKNKEI